MKYSQFNSIIPYEGKYMLYNSYTNNLVLMDPILKDLLEAAKIEGIDELINVHPSFHQALKDKEFILLESVNEVDKIKQLRNRVDFDETSYHLTINPTMNCNFKCWYCYETHVKASRMNEDIIRRVNKFLSSKIDNNSTLKKFTLSWFGGEPLLYFYDIILPVMEHFNSISKISGVTTSINFTSNGFLIDQKMINLLKTNNVESFQITLDGYGEEHDQVRYVSATRGSYFKIMENINLMVKNKIYVRLRINYTYKNIINCNKMLNEIKNLTDNDKTYLLIDFHRVWQDNVEFDESIKDSHIDLFRYSGFNVTSGQSMDNVRNSCYADKKNSAVINYNGDVFKCTARDFTKFKRDGFINETGEIIWENGSLENRMNIKFKNKPCLSCRLLPICNGGCSQHAVEYVGRNEEYCVYDFDDNKKNGVILQKVKEIMALEV